MINIEKLDNMPMREGMRVHYGWRERRSYAEWDIAKRILESHIGKLFDVAYSNFCHKIKLHHNKSAFLNEFTHKRYRYYISDYYVDDNGLIQKTVEHKSKKPLYIYSDGYKSEIVHKETNHLSDMFQESWSKRLVIFSDVYENGAPYYREYKENDEFLGYKYKGRYYFATDEDFVEKIISGSRIEVTSKNDYRYKRHWADRLKAKKSLEKKQKVLKQQEYLEKQRKLMQEKKRKEKEENDLKILAAGFDLKTSFRNRKKMSNIFFTSVV